jgi:lipoyl(octanoyl) transferase
VGFIGIAHKHGIVTHGTSLNVNVDLGWFQQIVPCGHVGLKITNINDELQPDKPKLTMIQVKNIYKKWFEIVFSIKLELIPP